MGGGPDTRGGREVRERRAWVPFGLDRDKPRHYREMAKLAWQNRDNLPYAWKILNRGVCDGCALGVAGMRDWTMDGPHLCLTRLKLLRLNTMGPMDPGLLADAKALAGADNRDLREFGRLAHPMLRRRGEGGFAPIGWDDALDRIATRIREADPARTAFYLTSKGLTNEVYYVAQKVARFLGTNNIDNAARICHSPSTLAMKRSLGVAAATCGYRDWYGTDLIVFFGSNPANDQPVTTKYILEARRLGTRVALVNPYLEPGMARYWVPSDARSALFGTKIADWWFGVAPGGDIAFLSGVMKILLERGWHDEEFTARHTTGLGDLRSALDGLDIGRVETESGLDRRAMREFAELLRGARNAVFVWSMGITQHAFGADAVQAILNLALARGYVGRPRNGVMPIRGHSSVQGAAEMGAYATALPGGVPIDAASAAQLSDRYGFDVPAGPGLTATEVIEVAHRGDLDVLYSLGGNFLRNLPDPSRVRRAMEAVPLRVHQDVIVTDQMLVPPREEVILLPARTRYEQEGGGTQTTTERRVIFGPEIPRRVGQARTEWRILCDVAARARPERAELVRFDSGQAIRDEIADVIPSYEGVERLRATGDSFQRGGPELCRSGAFPTPDGRARILAVDLPERDRPPGTFTVTTRRGNQFNSLVYGDLDPLTGARRDAVLMSPDDAARLHLVNGDPVTLESETGSLACAVRLAPVAPGSLQVHWPEGNVLVAAGRIDPGGVPAYDATVTVTPR